MACIVSPTMEKPLKSVTITDVYDIASAIGNDFERLIETFGAEPLSGLVPKVINVLEQLEHLAAQNQKEQDQMAELRYAVEKLQMEKTVKAEERAKYEKELEAIEESWRSETKELVTTVEKLQKDNKKLMQQLSNSQAAWENRNTKDNEKDAGDQLLGKMTEIIDKQREEIRNLQKEVKQKNVYVETLQGQLERLARLNADFKRRNSLTQRHAQSLIAEKVDLQAQLHDKEQQITVIRDRLQQESLDSPTSPTLEDIDQWHQKLTLEGKMVIDLKDPNRPRFTMNELRDVLQERNELKTKLIEVEEELLQYRPPLSDEEEVLPVQGPINREPDDKLHPDRFDSGIRKLKILSFEKKSFSIELFKAYGTLALYLCDLSIIAGLVDYEKKSFYTKLT
ncbi:DgyrCDS8276 [Dimorphilus gyrociliatus]|uniref:DgyrCDS7941 n=1 Tax=Dimorphilus gyrociliatus TaxID=2664684 RepID=A0A7I8VUW3_9ANNE|nr:DgyrCDS7941 [Dimorphilus gyrociliatus]CAD5119681.1 DgyrCDS8276 [Dimorphilus gyrociliatus]